MRKTGVAAFAAFVAGAAVFGSFDPVAADPAPAPAAGRSEPRPEALDLAYRDDAARLVGAALASDHAWRRLSELCDGIGHRLSGSKSLERAVRWAEKAMRADGLERVRLQPVMVPHWVRGDESALMVEPGPQTLSMLGLGRSIGTPRGGITADVVVAGSFRELAAMPAAAVRGKIVLWDVPFTRYGETVKYRGACARRAAERGAVATLVRSVGPTSLRTPHTGAMAAYVDSFPKIPAAAIAIEDAAMIRRLVERGQRVRVRLQMGARTLSDALSHNVIGEIRGRERPDEIVVVGGHLDSWDVGQGAHDDGAGCVISMEVLRLVRELGLQPRRTLRVVLWTNEENGLEGAKVYCDSLGDGVSSHVAAIETDGGVEAPIGFAAQMNRAGLDSVDVARTARVVERLRPIAALLTGLGADRITDSGGGADISPLMKKGVPGIAHRTVGTHYFDWHHTPADMMDKIDAVELRKNVAALAVVAWVLADMPGRLGDDAGGEAAIGPAESH
jgi:carboxypeptidase Q